MNHAPTSTDIQRKSQSATTEKKRGGKGAKGGAKPVADVSNKPFTSTANESHIHTGRAARSSVKKEIQMLNANTEAKFVLFNIKPAERVQDGPVMRGILEIEGEGDAEPVKVNVAAWHKVGRESGAEYLSLKVANNSADNPEQYSVGPFYGRLFKQVIAQKQGEKVRYFGFIEDSEKTGTDEGGRGIYRTNWQIRVTAKRATSNDGKTRYVGGKVAPSSAAQADIGNDDLPF